MRKRILFRDEEIALEIEWRIREERLKEGDRLPSERQLAKEFGVQRDTVRNALKMLIMKGMIVNKSRQGHFVAPKRLEINLSNFNSIRREVEGIGERYKAITLSYEIVSMSKELSEITQLPEGTLCYNVLRIRYGSDNPMSLEKAYIIAEHAPGLSCEDLEKKALSSLLRQRYGIILAGADQRITQVYPDNMEAELLRVKKDDPLIRYEGLIRDRKGRLIEYFDNVIMPDRIEFHLRDFA